LLNRFPVQQPQGHRRREGVASTHGVSDPDIGARQLAELVTTDDHGTGGASRQSDAMELQLIADLSQRFGLTSGGATNVR